MRPLALQQSQYELRVGETVQIAPSAETLDFLLKAKSLTVTIDGQPAKALIASPNRGRNRVLLAAPPRLKPGEYTAKLTATSATGEKRETSMAIVLKPMQQVPTGSSRVPVVLLNGWQTGITGECLVSNSSSDTFGNLAQYLVTDGVPIVYFFDNCAIDPNETIETLGNDLATYLNSIQYTNGDQVPEIDLVAFSMGGLIARAYLAGLQPDETVTPPITTLVRDLILIATPNFGSFVAGNYETTLESEPGTQDAELVPASSLLWNLATWNQRGDDLRGVNALAIIGNAGGYLSSLEATTQLNYASDGLVSVTSAALGFALLSSTPTQIVPYCHVDPVDFTNSIFGIFNCNAVGIANVTSETQETGEIVRSFLAGTSDWQSIGGTPAKDPWLSVDGGIFFAMQDSSGSYVSDLTAASWGSVALTPGADLDTVYYTDFVSGTGDYQADSSSLGTVNCFSLMEPAGFFSSARCKLQTAIFNVTPLTSAPGRIVASGGTITLTGETFGSQCNSCQVLATPSGATAGTALQIQSWSNTSISVLLPSSMTGYITLQVTAVPGVDAIAIMAAAPGPGIAASSTSLTFSYTAGATLPTAQTIQITNSGSGTLDWTATASDSWLSVSPASGTAPSTLSVSVSPASLSAGTYTGTIQIAATGLTTVSVSVTLTVTASTSTLGVSPSTLSFTYSVGGTAPAAQTVAVTTGGAGSTSWTALSSVFWATVSPVSASASGTLSVSVNPANLAAGSYTGNVTVTAVAGGTASVSITLTVTGTQPAGVITSVSNAGSYLAGFASATWVAIFGTNLSASTLEWGGSDFVNGLLPTSLDGVSVSIDGIPAYVEYISPMQINVLAPDDATTGSVQIQVTAAGQTSNSFAAQKQQYAPSFFTFDNGKYVAALHNSNYTYVGSSSIIGGATPAQPGEVIDLYGTGFGPTDPATPTSQLVTSAVPLPANSVQITIGGVAASVSFAGITASGLYQFDVTVPNNLPSGDAAVVATIGGQQTQSGLSITIGQ